MKQRTIKKVIATILICAILANVEANLLESPKYNHMAKVEAAGEVAVAVAIILYMMAMSGVVCQSKEVAEALVDEFADYLQATDADLYANWNQLIAAGNVFLVTTALLNAFKTFLKLKGIYQNVDNIYQFRKGTMYTDYKSGSLLTGSLNHFKMQFGAFMGAVNGTYAVLVVKPGGQYWNGLKNQAGTIRPFMMDLPDDIKAIYQDGSDWILVRNNSSTINLKEWLKQDMTVGDITFGSRVWMFPNNSMTDIKKCVTNDEYVDAMTLPDLKNVETAIKYGWYGNYKVYESYENYVSGVAIEQSLEVTLRKDVGLYGLDVVPTEITLEELMELIQKILAGEDYVVPGVEVPDVPQIDITGIMGLISAILTAVQALGGIPATIADILDNVLTIPLAIETAIANAIEKPIELIFGNWATLLEGLEVIERALDLDLQEVINLPWHIADAIHDVFADVITTVISIPSSIAEVLQEVIALPVAIADSIVLAIADDIVINPDEVTPVALAVRQELQDHFVVYDQVQSLVNVFGDYNKQAPVISIRTPKAWQPFIKTNEVVVADLSQFGDLWRFGKNLLRAFWWFFVAWRVFKMFKVKIEIH